jgi:predicted O-methyltransferase YrrM
MFKYPDHFILPNSENFESTNFHEKWIPNWETALKYIKNKDGAVGIEIGTLNGCSAVHVLESILTGKNTRLYCIDINETEFLKNNLKPYNNVTFIKGHSCDILRTLNHEGKNKEFADYVYIDGSHLAVDVLIDAVLSFHLLKPNGVIIFDDYHWGIHTNDETQKPKLGVDCFLNGYQKYYGAIQGIPPIGWQVYLKKTGYKHSEEEASANYELNGGKL